MSGLLPIIRRVRRPLLPVEAPTDAKPVAVPAAANVGKQATQGEDVKQQQGKDEHGEITSAQPAE
jgi:hypothetical protein